MSMSIPPIPSVGTVHPVALEEDHSSKAILQTLDQVLKKDCLKECLAPSPVEKVEAAQPSLWQRLCSFIWKKPEMNKSHALPSLETEITTPPIKPLDPVPEIEEPEEIQFTWTPSMEIQQSEQPISLPWVKEGLKLIAPSTIEEILFIVLKGQLELQKDIAEVGEASFKNQEKAQLLKEKILEEVKEALARDEKIAGYFKTAKVLTIVAGFVATLAIAVTFAPLSGGALLGGCVAGLKYAATTLGLLDGFKTALEAYFNSTANQNKASFAQARHEGTVHQFRMDEMHKHLMNVAETNNSFRQSLLKETRRVDRTLRLILQK